MRKYKKAHRNHNRIPFGWRISQLGYHMVDGSARNTIMKILVMRKNGYSLEKIKISLEDNGYFQPSKVFMALCDDKKYCKRKQKLSFAENFLIHPS